MNPNSSYDILYKGMSEEDRNRLQDDVSAALKTGVKEMEGILAREVEKAVTAMYSQLHCNPWGKIVEENSSQYEFVESIRQSIWNAMLKSSPEDAGKWPMRQLIESWMKNYPDELARIVGEETSREIKSLRERLDFEIRTGSRSL